MLEELISETQDRQALKPISKDAFSRWKNSAVTKRLIEELELAVIDAMTDYISHLPSTEQLSLVGKREGAAEMVETIMDWDPT